MNFADAIKQMLSSSLSQDQLKQLVKRNPKMLTKTGRQSTEKELREAASDLAMMLVLSYLDKVAVADKSHMKSAEGWRVVDVSQNPDGTFSAFLQFSGELHRDSLNPSSDGIQNIMSLYNTGFEVTTNTPFGTWHGNVIKGISSRPGTGFLDSALEEFNNKYKGKYSARFIDDTFVQNS